MAEKESPSSWPTLILFLLQHAGFLGAAVIFLVGLAFLFDRVDLLNQNQIIGIATMGGAIVAAKIAWQARRTTAMIATAEAAKIVARPGPNVSADPAIQREIEKQTIPPAK